MNKCILRDSRSVRSFDQVSLSSIAVIASVRAGDESANSTSSHESNMNRVKLGSESIEWANRNNVCTAGILNVFIK